MKITRREWNLSDTSCWSTVGHDTTNRTTAVYWRDCNEWEMVSKSLVLRPYMVIVNKGISKNLIYLYEVIGINRGVYVLAC